ncbi:MAG: LamG domain-containing protein [Planctomycetota bacterium]
MATYWGVHGDAVATWALQDSTGTTASDGTGVYTSPLLGGASFDNDTTTGPRPWLASALRFDGIDDYVSIPSPETMSLGAEHSLAIWFRADSPQPWPDQALIEIGGSVHATTLLLYDSSLFLMSVHNNSVHYASVTVPDDSAWHQAVAVHRASTVELYLDGVLVATGTTSQPWSADGSDLGGLGAINGGRWITGSDPFAVGAHLEGALAGAMLFRRALTPTEVDELLAGPEPALATPLTISGVVRPGDRLALEPTPWNGYQNGPLSTEVVLQTSNDGTTGWTDLEYTRGPSSAVVPLALVGEFVRLASKASNDGGESEEALSDAAVVATPRDPAVAAIGSVRSSSAEAGMAAVAGISAGQALPLNGENA